MHRGRVAAIAAGSATDIDLDALGGVSVQCGAAADDVRIAVGPPPADTATTNVAIALFTETDRTTEGGRRSVAPGGDAVVLEAAVAAAANEGFSGKITIGRTETAQHAVVEVAGRPAPAAPRPAGSTSR